MLKHHLACSHGIAASAKLSMTCISGAERLQLLHGHSGRVGADLLKFRPELRRRHGLQALQLALIAHRAHQWEAGPVGEQRLDGLPDLQPHADP